MEATPFKLEHMTWNANISNSGEHYDNKHHLRLDVETEGGMTLVGVVPEADHFGPMSDERLMRAIGQGESGALEVLYERYVAGCYGLALKIVRDPNLAEEIVQDVFLKLWTKPQSYVAERGKFSGWLLTLVHNRAIDKLRRAKAGTSRSVLPLELDNGTGMTLADSLPDPAPLPEEEAWREEKGTVVRRALSLLPETQREAINLAYFGGLTQKEIAERLGEPLGTIKTRTRSGLLQLRRLLAPQGLTGDAA